MRFEEDPARFASNSLFVTANQIDNAINLKCSTRREAVALDESGNFVDATLGHTTRQGRKAACGVHTDRDGLSMHMPVVTSFDRVPSRVTKIQIRAQTTFAFVSFDDATLERHISAQRIGLAQDVAAQGAVVIADQKVLEIGGFTGRRRWLNDGVFLRPRPNPDGAAAVAARRESLDR